MADLLAVYRELERWRLESKTASDASPNEFPRFERKAAFQSFVFFIVFLVSSYVWTFLYQRNSRPALLLLLLPLLISAVAGPLLFVFQACGLGKSQFWHALLHLFFGPKDHYPFSPLVARIKSDSAQFDRLRPFQTRVLIAAQERLTQDEAELRERLNTLVGTPTVFVTFGLLAGGLSAWENYHSHPNSVINAFVFFGSISAAGFGAYGFRLRMSLTELSRCRSLLSLIIADRAEGIASPHRSRARRRK